MLENVCTLKQYASQYNLDVGALRRYIRKNGWDGATKFGNTWIIDINATPPELPEPSDRGRKRDDGRRRFTVYATDDEITRVTDVVGADNVTDMRERNRERRRARKQKTDGDNGS